MKCLDLHRKKRLTLAARLPSYTPANMLIRFAIVTLIAVGALHLISAVIEKPNDFQQSTPFAFYLIIILTFNVAAEIQIVLDNVLERFFPVPEKIKLRVLIQVTVGILFLISVHRLVSNYFISRIDIPNSKAGIYLGLLTGLLFVQMVANSLTVARLTQKWIDTQEEIAEMKQEKLNMDYNSLQDQLNPHFLFNNLSVLKSLIIYDQETAVDFTENFTDVYRYVLQSKDKRLVKFSDEIEFVESYIGLHKERLGEGLQVKYRVEKDSLDTEIAPLTMQLLIENAIKHNITSRETPLQIEINADNESVVVANTMNLRDSSYSTKTGLRNLVKRYDMLTPKELLVQHNDVRFEVKVPLL